MWVSMRSVMLLSLRVSDHVLRLRAEPLDAEFDPVAGLEVAWRLLSHADAGGRAGRDHVAGVQGHESAEVADEMGHTVDHRFRRTLLHGLAVDLQPHGQRLRVGDLVTGDEPGPDLAEIVAALALRPLAGMLDLEGAFGNIVRDRVAGDMGQRVRFRDVFRAGADHDGELHLPVGLLRPARHDDRVVRAADGAGRLHEDDRLGRHLHAGLGGMVGIVEADADELAGAGHAGAKTGAGGDFGQVGGVGRAKPVEARFRQDIAADIVHDAGQVAQAAIWRDDAGALATALAVTDEFHGSPLQVFDQPPSMTWAWPVVYDASSEAR